MTLDQYQAAIQAKSAEFNALPLPEDMATPRQQTELWQQRQTLMAELGSARTCLDVMTSTEHEFITLTMWLIHLDKWRPVLCEQLLALPKRSPLERGVEMSIRRIDFDLDFYHEALPPRLPIELLMEADGYVIPDDQVARARGIGWHGSQPRTKRRLAELSKMRTAAKTELERLFGAVTMNT